MEMVYSDERFLGRRETNVRRIITIAMGSALLLGMSASPAAQAKTNEQELRAKLRKITLQTQQLQHEIAALRAELNHRRHIAPKTHARRGRKHRKSPRRHSTKPNGLEHYRHGGTVTLTPYLGLHQTAFDASDLLEQHSSFNEDLTLLQERAEMTRKFDEGGIPFERPILEIGGGIEGQIYDSSGFNIFGDDRGINLSDIELDFNAAASRWATAFLSLKYDNTPISEGNRQPRGVIFVRRGFVTIGNLNKFPLYFTLGESYAPFGRFKSGMVSAPLTLSMARIRTSMALLGYMHNGFHASLFGYSGDQTSGGTDLIKQAGVNAGYKHKITEHSSFELGGSYVSNLPDSEGMQNNGVPPVPAGSGGSNGQTNFSGFSVNANANDLRHRVGAFDIHGHLQTGDFMFIGEYITTLSRFNAMDMFYNNRTTGAKPQAMHAEVDYATKLFHKPFSIGIGYGHTWQALALNLPQNSYSAFIIMSIWKNTVQSLEYRHDTDYSTMRTAGGGIQPGSVASTAVTGAGIRGTGSSRNSIIAQLGVYF